MRSPIVAMLWEHWQLTRVEAAQRLGLGIVAGSAALALSDSGPIIAFWILIAAHAFYWFSIAKLNGGRFIDGYKPGFPLHLLYTRPVPTAVLVGVAMGYDAFFSAALYVVSAALLGWAFDKPLPLFSVAVYLVTYHLTATCVQWSTRNRVAQWIGSTVTALPFFFLLTNRVASSLQVEFSLLEDALMVLVGLVSFGLTVVGVGRQRRGGATASEPRAAGSAGYPDWLVTLFRFRCPTSSATRAQVWFELKSSGLPVLTIGLALAILVPLLFAISIAVMPVRPAAVAVALLGVPAVLFLLGANAFGIRRRQGRRYASSFEATQPYGTAQLAGLKVLVRSGCVVAALIAVGLSVWTSSSLLSAWGGWADGPKSGILGMLMVRRKIADALGGLTGYALAAQAVLVFIAVGITVAGLAGLEALRARYPRQVLIGRSLLVLWCLGIILLVLARRSGIASASLVTTVIRATPWIAASALVLSTVYLFWSGLAERVLALHYVYGALVIAAAFGAAWLTVLHAGGVQFAGMSAKNVAWILSPVLLPLMTSALAPWSLSRVRHI